MSDGKKRVSVCMMCRRIQLQGDLHLIQDTSVGEIAETLALSLKKPREDIILVSSSAGT